jgi:hypothetical protein
VPEPGVVQRDFVFHYRPIFLEPFVQPGEYDSAGGARLSNLPCQSCVDRSHPSLVVSSVAPPLRMQMCHAPAGWYPILRDYRGNTAVMCDELLEISEVARGTLGRPGLPVSGIEHHEIRVVGIGVVAGKPPGGISGRG